MNYTKTVWKDLPDTSTPITADRLNNIENGVEYLFENESSHAINEYSQSTTDSYSCNYVNNINTYSTDEIRVGTWMNKPLYRKVFTGTLGTEEVNIAISSLSCDFCYLEKGILISNGGPIYVIPTSYDVVESHTTFEIHLSQNKCRLQNGSSSSPYLRGTYYIILEYTKTTD